MKTKKEFLSWLLTGAGVESEEKRELIYNTAKDFFVNEREEINSGAQSGEKSCRFTDNDIDGVYLLGVFNASGLDGLANEIERLKGLNMNPSEMLEILKNEG